MLRTRIITPRLARCCPNQVRCFTQQKSARTAGSTVAQSTTKPAKTKTRAVAARSPPVATAATVPKTAVPPTEAVEEKSKAKSQDALAAAELERETERRYAMLTSGRGDPTVDPWAFKYPLLDLYLPKPWLQRVAGTKWSTNAVQRIRNYFLNTRSMYHMWKEYIFPPPGKRPLLDVFQIFRSGSLAPRAWMAPVRNDILKVYTEANDAVAKGDAGRIKALTEYEFQTEAKKRVAQRRSDCVYQWRFHGEAAPVKVVSIRSMIGHQGKTPPKTGSRLLVQLIARLETLQSLEVYHKGRLLRSDGTFATKDDPPVQPRTVVEYLVFENKYYYPHGWILRDQVFEGVEDGLTKVDRFGKYQN